MISFYDVSMYIRVFIPTPYTEAQKYIYIKKTRALQRGKNRNLHYWQNKKQIYVKL